MEMMTRRNAFAAATATGLTMIAGLTEAEERHPR
jgi:hypothetical protein